MTDRYDQEELKRMLVRKDGDFYLTPSRKIGATYKIVYCRLDQRSFKTCKVDVLTPGIMNIPHIANDRIIQARSIPIMPFIPLLLLKLQAWSDHRNSTRFDMRSKQYRDVSDIKELLAIGARRQEKLESAQWLPESFLSAATRRIIDFGMYYPECKKDWGTIGFTIPVFSNTGERVQSYHRFG